MRLVLILAVLLSGALTALHPAAALAARTATVTTIVLPAATTTSMRAFQPDSAPSPDSLTFLETMGICGTPSCDSSHPRCENESLFVMLGGHLPTSCHSIRKIALYYPPIVSIRPFAPWVVVYVDDGACLDQVCVRGHYPWSGGIVMPPLSEGPYTLDVAVVTVHCGEPLPQPLSPTRSMPFYVGVCDSIPPTHGCVSGDWLHVSYPTSGCDATIAPRGTAKVTFAVRSSAPLAALQGEFTVEPPELKIAALEVTGDATGFRFGWNPTPTGVRWFLFSDARGAIPGDLGLHPALVVTLAGPPQPPVPAETRVRAIHLLGSDKAGNAVEECPWRVALFPSPSALICGATDCDANHDGHPDVRDLVLMVNCLRGGVACPTAYDCNGDNSFTLDDVMCCAWRILRFPPCLPPNECPVDSIPSLPPRKDATVRVTTDLPVEQGGEIHVPIHIEGAGHVGAARLAMRFPSDRWRVLGVESNNAAWLALAGDERGEAIVGAIRIGEDAGSGALDLTLRLEPIGAAAGGELGSLSADVSATDGVRLIVPVVAPSRSLPGGPTVELSGNRPDPFSGETRFTLSLPKDSDVDLGVFDLGGRRVATLHRGTLKAGVSEFAWSGHADLGTRVGAGVYFYRAVTGARTVSRRMVYLGSR